MDVDVLQAEVKSNLAQTTQKIRYSWCTMKKKTLQKIYYAQILFSNFWSKSKSKVK